MKRDQIRRRTICLTVGALLSALGVVLLALGSLLDTIDLSVAAVASLFCVYAVIEMRGPYPYMVWAVTAGLALLLLPQKSPAVFYFFLGFYPILKEKMERLPSVPAWVLKLVFLHAAGALSWLGLRYLFAPGAAYNVRAWYLVLLYVAAVVVFILYDILLTRLITFYLVRLQKRLGIK